MITYELAKQLKDVGFPQDPDTFQGYYDNNCYVPSLSELIEACGPFFYQLINLGAEFGFHWAATYRSMTKELKSEGSTPTEAVARLWIELNKK